MQVKANKSSQETVAVKKAKRKTAGLNPLYVKSKTSAPPVDDKFAPTTFNKAKNVQKLSQMLEKNKTSSSNRLDLLLE